MNGNTLLVDTPERIERAQKVIGRLPLSKGAKPCAWVVSIARQRKKRSIPQNRRLFKLHAIAGEAVGLSEGEMHEEMLCLKYGYTIKKTPWGERKVPNERSSDKDPAEFNKFMEFCENTYIEQLGVFLGDDA